MALALALLTDNHPDIPAEQGIYITFLLSHREVHERDLRLSELRLLVLIGLADPLRQPLRVPMLADVHLGKGADVPHAGDIDGEVAQEVDNVGGLVAQVEVEDEGGDDRAQKLVQNEHLRMSQCGYYNPPLGSLVIKILLPRNLYSETCIKRPHVGQKKWSLYRGGLLKGAKIYVTTAVGT